MNVQAVHRGLRMVLIHGKLLPVQLTLVRASDQHSMAVLVKMPAQHVNARPLITNLTDVHHIQHTIYAE